MLYFCCMDTYFKKIRLEMRYTQIEMAERMNISRGAYIKLENGETHPVTDSVLAFSEATGIPLPEIIAGYYPERSGGLLKEELGHKEQMRRVVDEYEERLSRKNEEISNRDSLIESYRHTIRVQEQMLNLLQQQSGKKD